ncbi:(deoxy)nucleoside triphosphate pyrophosphohydrolase [Pontibacter sp. E15-1]|nr:(deoxy)nucleoside triphosphate pyrophosphohydrolase [Pontibacter sp. E15-1]
MPEPLLWEFPGGKMEPGETEEACLHREIGEELSLTIRVVSRMTPVRHLLPTGTWLELIPYRCTRTGGQLILSEHKAYRWCLPAELRRYTWCHPDVPIVEAYLGKADF